MSGKNFDEELAFAKDLATHAGQIMKRYFLAEDMGTIRKEDNTPLTIADTKINQLVIDRVKQEFPDHGVIGEEDSYETDRNFVWVVDPIDGTMPFSLGIPISTFSLGLVDRSDGQSVLGVVYDPFLNHLYSAARGKGAFLNDASIKTSKETKLKKNYVSIMGGRKKVFKPGHAIDLARQQGSWVFTFLSQVYTVTKIASGEMQGAIFGYGSPWDSAAASIIVEEAGGVVSDMEGNKRRYDDWGDGCICSANQEIHNALLEIVKNSST